MGKGGVGRKGEWKFNVESGVGKREFSDSRKRELSVVWDFIQY